MLNFNFLQFGEILGILPNTVAKAATSFDSEWPQIGEDHHLILPVIEIPKWFKFNHHQSVGNSISLTSFDSEWPQIREDHHLLLSVTEIPKWFKFNHHQSVRNSISFLVGPKFSKLVVWIAIPSKDVANDLKNCQWTVHIFINGKDQKVIGSMRWANGNNYDHVWLIYGKVNISNPSEKNRIEVEVKDRKPGEMRNIYLNRMRIYVECICCPQKPNISPPSSMDQCAFNNGEEDSGHVGIRRRLRRRNHRPTHARRPQKHYLSHFGWLRIQYRLWKPSSKPWRQRITNGFHGQGSSLIPNTFSMMIPRPILLHQLNPTLKRRFA